MKGSSMLVKVDSVKVGKRFRRSLGDIQALAENIKEHGLLCPVAVTPDYELIAGERRLKAFQMLGRDEIPAFVVDTCSVLMGEWSENEMRQNFSTSERVAIGKAVEKELAGRKGSNQHKQKESQEHVQNFAQAEAGEKTREIAAKRAGFGNAETYRQAKKVVESGDAELIEAMDAGEIAPSAAAKKVAEKVKPERAAQKPREEPQRNPAGYDALIADWNKASHAARERFMHEKKLEGY